MSLVGNLEDLSLGDILQIISLSQKSGVLALASDQGTGRIVFRGGLVEAACVKGAPNNLRDLLVSHGEVDPAAFDACVAKARELGEAVEAVLAREAGLDRERIDALAHATVESAILQMFTWPSGEFSFDVRTALDAEDPTLTLAHPLNAQYLAMEGLRLRDEHARDATRPGEGSGPVSAIDDPLFGDDPEALEAVPGEAAGSEPGSPEDVLVGALVDRLDPSQQVGLTLEEVEAAMPLADAETTAGELAPKGEEERPADVHDLPVVLIDPDVVVLEWAKAALRSRFARVHVFQQAEQGLSRIRQYLIRGQQPLVVVSPETPIDPLSGIHGLADFVKRLKAQAPRLVVLGLRAADADDAAGLPVALDGLLVRPMRARLTSRSSPETVAAGEDLARALVQRLPGSVSPKAAPRPAESGANERSASLKGLRDATIRLQEASSRGEILPVVLDFAHDLFDRVAILIVREQRVFAVAGRGVRALEIDPLGSDPAISFPVPESGWIQRVIEHRSPIRAAPEALADRELLEALGPETPAEAYLAPIESGSAVIAILYGDQATGGAPMPDTHALEVVLQYAGLALDRAALERALWEVEGAG